MKAVTGTIRFSFKDWDEKEFEAKGWCDYGYTVYIEVPDLNLQVNSGTNHTLSLAIESAASAVNDEVTKFGMLFLMRDVPEQTE